MSTNGTIVQLRRNSTRDVAPDGTIMYEGEVAINTANRKLYTAQYPGEENGVESVPFGILEANQLYWHHTNDGSVQVLDSFDINNYSTAKYFIEVRSGIGGDALSIQAMEAIVIHDKVDAYITRYGVIETGVEIATITADIDSGLLRLKVTSNAAGGHQYYLAKFVRIMQQI